LLLLNGPVNRPVLRHGRSKPALHDHLFHVVVAPHSRFSYASHLPVVQVLTVLHQTATFDTVLRKGTALASSLAAPLHCSIYAPAQATLLLCFEYVHIKRPGRVLLTNQFL
jgi:hypothetical protein